MLEQSASQSADIQASAESIINIAKQSGGSRIAIMGPNGAGKTRLVAKISDLLKSDDVRTVFVPAKRDVEMRRSGLPMGSNIITHDVDEIFSRALDELTNNFIGMRPRHTEQLDLKTLISQIASAVKMRDSKNTQDFKDALYEWDLTGGAQEAKPSRPQPQLERLQEQIGGVIGRECRISFPSDGTNDPKFEFRYGDVWRQFENLSDGEKQVLFFVSVHLGGKNIIKYLIVDEPELHLNERLAGEMWERLENLLADTSIIYATHSVYFATRPGIERLFLLDMTGNIQEIASPSLPPKSALQTIIGGRIQILRSEKHPVFCEDRLSSLIVADIMHGADIDITVLPGHADVDDAVRSERSWESLKSGGMKPVGIIDRDARSENEVTGLEEKGIFCLPFYDAEALFQDEQLLSWSINSERDPTNSVSAQQVEDMILKSAASQLERTIDKHAKYITRQHQAKIKRQKIGDRWVFQDVQIPDRIKTDFIERLDAVQLALDNKSYADVMKLFYGKGVYSAMVRHLKDMNYTLAEDPEQKYLSMRNISGFREKLNSIRPLHNFAGKIKNYLASA